MKQPFWKVNLILFCALTGMLSAVHSQTLPTPKSGEPSAQSSSETDTPHFLPPIPLPPVAERKDWAKKLLKTSRTLTHTFIRAWYTIDGSIPFYGEYAVLLSHAGDKTESRRVLRELIPKAEAESRSQRVIESTQPQKYLCDALIWIARCQEEAGFRNDARATLYRAKPLAFQINSNGITDYSLAYDRVLSPRTAIAVALHRIGDKTGFRQTMQAAMRYARKQRTKGVDKWEEKFAETAYAYAVVGDTAAAQRELLKLPPSANYHGRLPLVGGMQYVFGKMILNDSRIGNLSAAFRTARRFADQSSIALLAELQLQKIGDVKTLLRLWRELPQSTLNRNQSEKNEFLAFTYAHRGDHKQAILYAQRFIAQSRREGDPQHEFLSREMRLLSEIPYLPEASKLLRYHQDYVEKVNPSLDGYSRLGKIQHTFGDKISAYHSYKKALEHMDDLNGPGDGVYFDLHRSLLALGLMGYLPRVGMIITPFTLEVQMRSGGDLLRFLKPEEAKAKIAEVNDAWMMLGAVQKLLNRPALFVEKLD